MNEIEQAVEVLADHRAWLIKQSIDCQCGWQAGHDTNWYQHLAQALADAGLLPVAKPGRWWRSVGPDGELWGESSDEEEIREMARPGDVIERLWVATIEQWRPA
jgi:hypothetical protein